MDKSIQYTQVMSNFDSVYNSGPNLVHHPTIYMPISSSSSFSTHSHRSISSSMRSSNPKFNLDLYKPNEYHSESIDYPSPSSSVIIHHHPVYSPPPSQAISKLRQINDELCYTLAQCDITTQSQPSPSHHYIHHYPISHETYRSRSPSEQDSSSTESEPITKKRNARITYKARIPRRRRQKSLSKIDQLLISTSDAYAQDDPMTIDLYPTREQGFIKKIRNRPDNQSPWLADNSPIRRNSYSEASTYRTPRAPYYGDEPIQPKSRLASGKERLRSSSVKSRIRPDTAPNPLRQSAASFSNTAPAWQPSGSIKHPKFIGSNAPPSKSKPPPREATWNPAGTANKTKPFRAFDPVAKSLPIKVPEPRWQPASKVLSKKPHRYFEPTLKPELIAPIRKETEPLLQKKTIKNQTTIPSGDPKLKTRIAKAESKVKSAWESTTTATEPKPPTIPRPIKTITTTPLPPKTKVKSVPTRPIVPVKKPVPVLPITTDTGRSSLNDIPTKPMFQSTPRNQSIVNENDDNVDDLFENESQISEPTKKPDIPHPPPRIEKTPTKLPPPSVPEPDKGTKSTIKNGVLIHGDDADNIRDDNRTPSPMSEVNHRADDDDEEALNGPSSKPLPILPERKASSPKPDNRDDVSIVDDEDVVLPDDTNEDLEITTNVPKKADIVSPSIPKTDIKTPPREKVPSPSPPREKARSPPPLHESPHQTAFRSPIISKKNDRQLPSTPPAAAAATTTHNEADDFFD